MWPTNERYNSLTSSLIGRAYLKIDLQSTRSHQINSSSPQQNGCHFADDILNCFFMKENCMFQFHRRLFPRIQITGNLHLFNDGLVSNRPQAIIWTNADLIQWRV